MKETTANPEGMIQSLKYKFEEWIAQFNRERFIELGTALIIGFVVGFLLKKLGRFLILTILLMAIVFGLLSYFDFIAINWVAIKRLVGLSPSDDVRVLGTHLWLWVRTHILDSIVALIGFLIGYSAG